MPVAEAEIARGRLLELAPAGFAELEHGDRVELAAYTDASGEEWIRGAFANVSSTLVEPGWESRWRTFHRPVRAGGLWIGPPWARPPADETAVAVDPGLAFGTGAHPTTRACIELLAGLDRGSLLDAGCGSGVVAVAAVRLGFAPVVAVDLDPVAVDVTRDTARRNGVRVDARHADVLRDDLPHAEVLVANIDLRVVEALLGRLPATIAVTSGYLADESPRVVGWRSGSRLELAGWAADVLTAK